jgi:two-component system NarL family response regulator
MVWQRHGDRFGRYAGLQAGAKAYLLKDTPREELLACIQAVHAGRSFIPLEVGAKLTERMNSPELSKRESEVLQLMAAGISNLEIGEALSITEGTVKSHINNILSKLNVSDRTQAVIAALKRGIVRLPYGIGFPRSLEKHISILKASERLI